MKLFVFMMDALCASDIDFMKTLPHFAELFKKGSYVKSIEPVCPALTYCCHTSIVTGKYVKNHGIVHNEILQRGAQSGALWHGMRKDVKSKTLLDYAREAGLTTCSLSWPVSGGADYTYNMPMIVPYSYKGWNPESYLENAATKNLMDKYFWKYGRYIKGNDRSLDLYTMAIAPDLIQDFGQPDVMLVKMCDLDSVRHTDGVYHENTKEQLRKHDEEFGILVETIKRYGDYENTNFMLIGDHGQTDIHDVLKINKLFVDNGFITLDKDGNIESYIAYGHSTGLACFIEVSDPSDEALLAEVKAYLETLIDDPVISLAFVYDAQEACEKIGLAGPFDFVIESNKNIAFKEDLDGISIWGSKEPGNHKTGAATHGSCIKDRVESTTLVASGPAFKQGVVIEVADMVDEAPTMAAVMGIEMNDIDGRVLKEILR
ncbi:MAG: alkaline phosphatase family protein [Erysipelotrichaceae bacterium]|nr:alkaline phosphatase family protein [Erysipelotrichaceae bacterium]MDD4642906.1 alkaline phosphatase family protein [Erysipelotrichaceae bacterium]